MPLVEELRELRLSVVGTIRVNRQLVPKELMSPDGRQHTGHATAQCHTALRVILYSRSVFSPSTLLDSAGKVVQVLSSQHKLSTVDNTGKPESILYYNSTKGDVDVIDAIMEDTQDSRCGQPLADAGVHLHAVRRLPELVLRVLHAVPGQQKRRHEARRAAAIPSGARWTAEGRPDTSPS